MSYTATPPSILFTSSGSADLKHFRVYYIPVFAGPGATPIPEPFDYFTVPYFVVLANPSSPGEPTVNDYEIAIDITTDAPDGVYRFSIVEEDIAGNLSDFSVEIEARIDRTPPSGVSGFMIAPII